MSQPLLEQLTIKVMPLPEGIQMIAVGADGEASVLRKDGSIIKTRLTGARTAFGMASARKNKTESPSFFSDSKQGRKG